MNPSDSPPTSTSLSSIPYDSYHHIPLKQITKGYENTWKGIFTFDGNCMKKRYFQALKSLSNSFRAYSDRDDPEEIERRDEYICFGVNDSEFEIRKVFPKIKKSFRKYKYGQPNFLKLYFTRQTF